MKKIIFILGLMSVGYVGHAQTLNPFPTTDSLRRFINKWIRNSAVDAFTNLRLNTSLIGMSRFLDSAYGGQVTGFTYSNDTFRIATLGGDTLKVAFAVGATNSNIGAGFRLLVPSSQGIKTLFAGNTVLIDSTSNTNGITVKVDTSVIATVNDLTDSTAFLRARDYWEVDGNNALLPVSTYPVKVTQTGLTSNGFPSWPSVTTFSKGVLGAYGAEPSIDILVDSTSQFQIGALTWRTNKLASGGVADKFPKLPASRNGAGAYAQIEANAFRNGSAPWTSTIEFYLGDSTGSNVNVPLAVSGPGSHFFGERRYFTAESKEALFFATAINRVNNFSFGNLNTFFAGNLNSLPAYLFNMPLVSLDSTNNKVVVYNPSTSAINYMNWPTGGGSTSPAGSNTQIQYNSSGSFGASANFTYDGTTIKQNNATAATSISSTTALGSTSGGDIRLLTSATPTAADQRMGGVLFGTLDGGSTENPTAGIEAFSTVAHTPGSAEGTHLRFSTTAVSTRTEVMRLTANLRVGILNTNPGTYLGIGAGNSSTNPFGLTQGTRKTTPANGEFAFDNATLLFAPSGSTYRRFPLMNDVTPAVGAFLVGNGVDFTLQSPATTFPVQTYTPTLTGVTNITGLSTSDLYYQRIGMRVHVWGTIGIDPTATSTLTEIGVSLPIASTLSATGTLSGSGYSDTIAQGIAIKADNANDRAMISFFCTDASSVNYYFNFTYEITPP